MGDPGKAKQGRGKKKIRKNRIALLKFLKVNMNTSYKRTKNPQSIG